MGPLEVFRSRTDAPARERELVLRSAGIPYHKVQHAGDFVLVVDEAFAERALRELADYESENRDWPPKDVAPPVAGGRWEGVLVYALVITGFFLLQGGLTGGIDWTRIGASGGAELRDGEIWRGLTALTLHADVTHLLSNLIFGAFFGFLVSSVHGGGPGWFAIVLSAFLGNLLNGWVRGPDFLSIGASTAVFSALGIVAGSEWRRRNQLRTRRLRRWAPPLLGSLLFSFLGVGGERTDIGAHVFGFLVGLPAGALLPMPKPGTRPGRRRQLAWGLAALALVGAGWAAALLSS